MYIINLFERAKCTRFAVGEQLRRRALNRLMFRRFAVGAGEMKTRGSAKLPRAERTIRNPGKACGKRSVTGLSNV